MHQQRCTTSAVADLQQHYCCSRVRFSVALKQFRRGWFHGTVDAQPVETSVLRVLPQLRVPVVNM
eukprot:4098961-Alexandrium_andersonii.AAC.1